MVYCACKHIIQSLLLLVQFWTPSPVTQRWGEKGPGSFVCACSRQTNRNAHYVNMFVSPRNTKTGTKIIPARFKQKCRRTKLRRRKKHVKPGLENCKVCGITTLKNARAVISKPIVTHTTSTCLFHHEIQKLARKLFQHASRKNVGERSYDAEKNMSNQA